MVKKKEKEMENEQNKMRKELETLIARQEQEMKDWKKRSKEEEAKQSAQRQQIEAESSKLGIPFLIAKNVL